MRAPLEASVFLALLEEKHICNNAEIHVNLKIFVATRQVVFTNLLNAALPPACLPEVVWFFWAWSIFNF